MTRILLKEIANSHPNLTSGTVHKHAETMKRMKRFYEKNAPNRKSRIFYEFAETLEWSLQTIYNYRSLIYELNKLLEEKDEGKQDNPNRQ